MSHARRGRCGVAVAERPPGPTRAAAEEEPCEEKRHAGQAPADDVRPVAGPDRQEDPVAAAGEVRVGVRERRHDERDRERCQREVGAAQPQRRDADQDAEREGRGRGRRDRGEGAVPRERVGVVAVEDRGRVAADGHERPVPERDLAGVAREEVEPEDRDEEDRDLASDELVVVGQMAREQHDHGHRGRDHEETEREPPHTRRTTFRPKSPVGLITSIASSSASAAGSRNDAVTKCT